MKANELMIGDWVYSSFYYNSTKPCRITGIRTFDIKDVYAFVYVDKIENVKDINSLTPIPLTPEILENNGFVKKKFQGHLEYCYCVQDQIPSDKIYCVWLGESTHSLVLRVDTLNQIRLEIKYVHQLQHALRLCGIEKTIEL